MRVGIFIHDFFPIIGGQGMHMKQLHDQFLAQGFSDFLIFSPNTNSLPNHICLLPQFQYHHSRTKNIGWSLALMLLFPKLIRQYGLDVLHIHTGPGALCVFRDTSIPQIHTCHHTYHQQIQYIPQQYRKRPLLWAERLTYRFAKKIICVSPDTAEDVRQHYGVEQSRIAIIPNGVEELLIMSNDVPHKLPFSLVFVGRLDTRKGIDRLCSVVPLLIRRFPSLQLFVVGTGALLPALRAWVDEHRLNKHILFCGYVGQREKQLLIAQAQCMIVPSMFEGFGISVLEGMQQGTVVIGTDVPGIRGIIAHRHNGYLVPYGNDGALCSMIEEVLLNDQQSCINHAKKTLEQYNRKTIAQQTIDMYEGIGKQ